MQPYEGKAKRVTSVSDSEVEIYFKNDATAFNGVKHELFDGKGELNSQVTERLYEYLHTLGVATHHLGRKDERTLKARKVEIVPLECVVRFRVAGSLQKRTGLEYFAEVAPPVVEFYFKRDDLGDPILNREHIELLGLATPEELAELRSLSVTAATHVKDLFAKVGVALVDIKFEFGRTPDGIVLADEISPDTCRFRDLATGEVRMDKDLFRFDKGDLMDGYRKLLAHLDDALTQVGFTPGAGSTPEETPRVQG
jgi:phosphoribosylaminoimidazole-succinocarboxamide synthase